VHFSNCSLSVGKKHDRLLTQCNIEVGIGNWKFKSTPLQELDLVKVGSHFSRDFEHGRIQLHAGHMSESANTKGRVSRNDSRSARYVQYALTRL